MNDHLRRLIRDLFLNGVLASSIVPRPLRWRALRRLGAKVEHSAICGGLWLGSTRLAIGEGTFINYGCRIDNSALVKIGRNCDIAPGVSLLTTTHAVGDRTRRAGAAVSQPIVIGDGVWIGANATVLPGVTIGDGVVVGAGAVVTQDCAPDTVVVGVPARVLRSLTPGLIPPNSDSAS